MRNCVIKSSYFTNNKCPQKLIKVIQFVLKYSFKISIGMFFYFAKFAWGPLHAFWGLFPRSLSVN